MLFRSLRPARLPSRQEPVHPHRPREPRVVRDVSVGVVRLCGVEAIGVLRVIVEAVGLIRVVVDGVGLARGRDGEERGEGVGEEECYFG